MIRFPVGRGISTVLLRPGPATITGSIDIKSAIGRLNEGVML
ncbi:hypothetical protein [Thermogemmatispora sp.]